MPYIGNIPERNKHAEMIQGIRNMLSGLLQPQQQQLGGIAGQMPPRPAPSQYAPPQPTAMQGLGAILQRDQGIKQRSPNESSFMYPSVDAADYASLRQETRGLSFGETMKAALSGLRNFKKENKVPYLQALLGQPVTGSTLPSGGGKSGDGMGQAAAAAMGALRDTGPRGGGGGQSFLKSLNKGGSKPKGGITNVQIEGALTQARTNLGANATEDQIVAEVERILTGGGR